jgi:hypothetical protein
MSVDRRTLILDRLEELLSTFTVELLGDKVTGPMEIDTSKFVRNRGELPDEKTPGTILLDGDEVRDPRYLQPQAGRSLPPGTAIMRMTPEIYIVLNVRKPQNENVGQDLNTARAALLDLVLHDKQLLQIVGANGAMAYDGCVTDLARNRTMKGQMGLSLTFIYPLIPGELVGLNGEA